MTAHRHLTLLLAACAIAPGCDFLEGVRTDIDRTTDPRLVFGTFVSGEPSDDIPEDAALPLPLGSGEAFVQVYDGRTGDDAEQAEVSWRRDGEAIALQRDELSRYTATSIPWFPGDVWTLEARTPERDDLASVTAVVPEALTAPLPASWPRTEALVLDVTGEGFRHAWWLVLDPETGEVVWPEEAEVDDAWASLRTSPELEQTRLPRGAWAGRDEVIVGVAGLSFTDPEGVDGANAFGSVMVLGRMRFRRMRLTEAE